MMTYREIKAAYLTLLADQSLGQFRVLGYYAQTKHSEAVKESKQLLEIIYSQGQFPKNSSAQYGPVSHDISFDVVLTPSAGAKGDLSSLENPYAPTETKAAALASIKAASAEADDNLDSFIDSVFQILMDARNDNAGLPVGTIANRFIDSIQKFDALEHGNLVVRTAVIKFSCRVSENIRGETGTAPDIITISSDLSEATGIDVNNDNI